MHGDAVGIDVSPRMIQVARERAPRMPFVVASMLRLPVADAALSGVLSLYSIIHFNRSERATAFGELARVTCPGGWLLVSFHVDSDELAAGDVRHVTSRFRQAVDLDGHFMDPEDVARDVEASGFTTAATVLRSPWPGLEFLSRRCYLLARRS